MIELSTVNYIFGSPGCGKSTVLAMLSVQLRKKGYTVYSNVEISGTYLYDDEDFGKYSFKSPSKKQALLIDEAGVVYNNRQFKNGLLSDPDRMYYWKRVRHDADEGGNTIVVMVSQSWSDIDKKCRDLSTSYFHLKKYGPLTVIRPIYKKCEIDNQTHEPVDFYVIDIFFHYKYCFRPLYYEMFDSFEMKPMPNWLEMHPEIKPLPFKNNTPLKKWLLKSTLPEFPEEAGLSQQTTKENEDLIASEGWQRMEF